MKVLEVNVKFNVNSYNNKDSNKEYTFLSSLAIAPNKGDIVLVNTRYGYSLARVSRTSMIEVSTDEYESYAHILSVVPMDILVNRDRTVTARTIEEVKAMEAVKAQAAQKLRDDLWSLQAELKVQKAAMQKTETRIKSLTKQINSL